MILARFGNPANAMIVADGPAPGHVPVSAYGRKFPSFALCSLA